MAIRARFDGKVLIPEQPVELPQGRTLIVHIESETNTSGEDAFLKPVLVPSDPEAARRLIHDAESSPENF